MMPSSCRLFVDVCVPATSANLGPGFDVLGLALSLYNHFTFAWASETHPHGAYDALISPLSPELSALPPHQLGLFQALDRAWQWVYPETPRPPVIVTLTRADIPLARGLGSSASAVVAALIGINALANLALSLSDMAALAVAVEGHGDNVLPALYGGLMLCLNDPPAKALESGSISKSTPKAAHQNIQLPWPAHWQPIVIIPESRVSTEKARLALSPEVSREDAVFNLGRLAAWVSAAYTGRDERLASAMADRLHQPVRSVWIEGFEAYHHAAVAAGAFGLVISGSGPTMLALCHVQQSAAVQKALQACADRNHQPNTKILPLAVDHPGARVLGWA
ncbi:MAG: homoserine kinase [Vampirovibrionales bacterium]|nr:homoserine kinase [Vampirovibrionales bacterium]